MSYSQTHSRFLIMTKLNIDAFKALVKRSRSKTSLLACAAKEKVSTMAMAWAQAEKDANVDEVEIDLTNAGEDFSLDKDEKAEKNSTVALNWLIKLVTDLWFKVSQHAELIRFNLGRAEEKEEEVAKLVQEVELLRKHCDEVQQRSMKGNLIISSPTTKQKKSLMNLEAAVLHGDHAREDATSLCIRLIDVKTGVKVPPEDISACHILKKQGNESSFIIRFHNMKPGSAWERITAGLMTGKVNGQCFSDANVYINYQVTKARGELLKKAREARKDGLIRKYSTDQNGNISVQISQRGSWTRISSPSDLQQLITDSRRPAGAATEGAADRWQR